MGMTGWIGGGIGRSAHQRRGRRLASVRGGIDQITPSLVSGWVQHPDLNLVEVRLLVGQHLFAQALVQESRPDVEEHLGLRGNFGFQLAIPAELPLLAIDEEPRLLALTADGGERLPLTLQGNPAVTGARLRAALAPQHRGLRGHFDGFNSDGTALQGWCYRPSGGVATVWLWADGLPPRPCTCDQYRPGMAEQGHSEWSGFALPLTEWPEAAGRRIWASFDEPGELRLPQATVVELPSLRTLPTQVAPTPAASEAIATTPRGATAFTNTGQPQALMVDPGAVDLGAHWQALERFRELLDRLESEVYNQEQASLRATDQTVESAQARSRRSARFRLWR